MYLNVNSVNMFYNVNIILLSSKSVVVSKLHSHEINFAFRRVIRNSVHTNTIERSKPTHFMLHICIIFFVRSITRVLLFNDIIY